MGLKVDRKILKTQKHLEALDSGVLEVGWFAENKEAAGKLTAPQLAAILSYGAVLKGGQPYFFDKKGNLVFMKRTGEGTKPKGAMGITKPSYIPPRPMLDQASRTFSNQWEQKARQLALNILQEKITVQQALEQLGGVVAADIKNTMRAGAFAANSKLTAKKKGKNTPLIDTGSLADKVDFKAQAGRKK